MDIVYDIAERARNASLKLASYTAEQKNAALEKLAELVLSDADAIIAENKIDLAAAEGKLSKAMLERLALDPKKIAAIAEGVRQVAKLPDPVGEIIESNVRPNGLRIDKVRVPIGVIAIIYESRPNVTVDCAALCLKSGNTAILRGGSECFKTNTILAKTISRALSESGLDPDCVQMIPTTDRAEFAKLLKLDKFVNCVIPRGGEKLIRFVVETATVPVLKHYKGVCTVYVDKSADDDTAQKILINAKCQRPSVCNAAENLLVHADAAKSMLPKLAKALAANGVEIRATQKCAEILDANNIKFAPATDDDFSTEYDDLVISVDIADSLEAAVDFINRHSSAHSDAIVATDGAAAEKFLNGVDSATVYWNASTRFTDGFEFGFGAEIGISTDKLHARGPMGLKELCSYKYKIYGNGQIRG